MGEKNLWISSHRVSSNSRHFIFPHLRARFNTGTTAAAATAALAPRAGTATAGGVTTGATATTAAARGAAGVTAGTGRRPAGAAAATGAFRACVLVGGGQVFSVFLF